MIAELIAGVHLRAATQQDIDRGLETGTSRYDERGIAFRIDGVGIDATREQGCHFVRAIDRYRLHEPVVERLRVRSLETEYEAYQECDADRAPSSSHR
ncbi:MAG: hypothetical protein E6H67_13310 [Betaproteobacteria bacterium]|nr:MAG: hypothetical protein E6H67_13310 [Betaproteobacteria bacterium]